MDRAPVSAVQDTLKILDGDGEGKCGAGDRRGWTGENIVQSRTAVEKHIDGAADAGDGVAKVRYGDIGLLVVVEITDHHSGRHGPGGKVLGGLKRAIAIAKAGRDLVDGRVGRDEIHLA